MAETDSNTAEWQQPASAGDSKPITRDPTFTRIMADEVIVIDRGRDMEFALVVHGPDPIARSTLAGGVDQGTNIQMLASHAEVARLRLLPPDAVNMAMQILERNLVAKRIDVDAFRVAILALLEEHADNEDPVSENADNN